MTIRVAVPIAATLLLLHAAPGAAQDPLSRARTLYASADYEQALKVLESVPVGRDTHYMRALCLIALGREDAASRQIAALVQLDPLFVPPVGEVSPRVSAAFADTRRRLLPEIVRRTFNEAREAFQAADQDRARELFERTLEMLDDAVLDEDDDLADLRLVASGFLDLMRATPVPAAEPDPLAVAAAAPSAPPAADPAADTAAESSEESRETRGVATPPVTIQQDLPPWRPDSVSARRSFSGAVRVEIDEHGRVTAAYMERPVYPPYDELVLQAARNWRYQPATLNGVPIPSEKTVEIQLRPAQ